ncbi:MAG: glucose-6-phosphate isomerase [Elusimicrobia bacterium HGW-Elusimicrobia-1]|nr:MAG: glucose-6-phosphate isomerase [Elusimicrobia bacterium HGW-Elusimicrobia-1]
MDVKLNYTYSMSDVVGEHGVTAEELLALKDRLSAAKKAVGAKKAAGKLGFMELPYKTEDAAKIKRLASKLKKRFDNFVVVGIGGSALGNIALQGALRHPFWNLLDKKSRGGWMRIFVPDNVDPELVKGLAETIDFKKTVFNVISKSGTTAEGLANFFFFKKILENKAGKKYRDHLVFTTDSQKGFLRELASTEGIESFDIPANVGGRFSALSPVGLISAAAAGIKIDKILSGAKAMDQKCSAAANPLEDPAAVFAALNYLLYLKGKRICVMMPYSNALYPVADWFRQLWAESLGKKSDTAGKTINVGPTPVKALGATDQHSQVQLYIEGPYDKVVVFLSAGKFRKSAPIPKVGYSHYLEGRSLGELIKCEEDATRTALAKEQRANMTIDIPTIDEENIGGLLYMLELATAYAGELFDINAFDQPGVELGKQLTYGLMGRAGFETQKKDIEEFKNRFTARKV